MLWRTGQLNFFLLAMRTIRDSSGCERALRVALRLIASRRSVESSPLLIPSGHPNLIIHHFEQTIGGRAYQIEVTLVSNRWRAQLRRGPGVPTAMMPFYGQTPDEAAGHLWQWLSLTHQRFAAAATARASTI
jgi:hypothetical protein